MVTVVAILSGLVLTACAAIWALVSRQRLADVEAELKLARAEAFGQRQRIDELNNQLRVASITAASDRARLERVIAMRDSEIEVLQVALAQCTKPGETRARLVHLFGSVPK